uniref:DSL-like protein 2 n=1 Tax=Platynereis dumerilii TaxID=6359 RepID=A0A1C6ZZX0_PLADU|nr:DSL-like protein 2 [Platynereis dumerilii]
MSTIGIPSPSLCFYLLVFIHLSLPDAIRGDAMVELEFIKFENREGKGDNGHCCDGKWGICQPNGCDHRFKICLGTSSGRNDADDCPYGKMKSSAINNQDVNTFGTKIGNLHNPLPFHFRGPLPPSFKLKVSVDDKDMLTGDFVDLLIHDLHITGKTDRTLTIRARTSLKLHVHVRCDHHFYGEHCEVKCVDGTNFYCDHMTGKKVCKEGFTGNNCDHGVCSKFACHHGGRCTVTSSGNPKCLCSEGYLGVHCDQSSAHINDCDDINRNPDYKDKSGVYEIRPRGSPISFNVYCKMQNNRGWTVLQRRIDGSVNFNRNWTEYRRGFGELGADTEFWMGLDEIHYLTAQRHKRYMLRIDMEDHFGEQRHADYGEFAVEGEREMYKLHVGNYQGNGRGWPAAITSQRSFGPATEIVSVLTIRITTLLHDSAVLRDMNRVGGTAAALGQT